MDQMRRISWRISLAAHYASFRFRSEQLHTVQQLQIEFKTTLVVYFMEMLSKWYKFFVITSGSGLNTHSWRQEGEETEGERAHQFKLTMIIGFSKVLINCGGSKALFIFPRVPLSLLVLHDSSPRLANNTNWAIWQYSEWKIIVRSTVSNIFELHRRRLFPSLFVTFFFQLGFCAAENFLLELLLCTFYFSPCFYSIFGSRAFVSLFSLPRVNGLERSLSALKDLADR